MNKTLLIVAAVAAALLLVGVVWWLARRRASRAASITRAKVGLFASGAPESRALNYCYPTPNKDAVFLKDIARLKELSPEQLEALIKILEENEKNSGDKNLFDLKLHSGAPESRSGARLSNPDRR